MKHIKVRRSKRQSAKLDGEFLAIWLNDTRDWGGPPDSRSAIRTMFLQLTTLIERAVKGGKVEDKELDPINKALALFPSVTQLVRISPGGHATFFKNCLVSAKQFDMGEIVLRLLDEGLLDRLRRCAQCGIWFFASVPKAKFHSTACRQENFRSTPEYKEKNRAYQRDWYRKLATAASARNRPPLKWPKEKRNVKKR